MVDVLGREEVCECRWLLTAYKVEDQEGEFNSAQ
jgi:hypothetical protein